MLKSGRVVKGGRGGQASGGRTLEDAFKASRGRRTQKGREEDVLSVEVEDEDRESVGEGPLSPPVHLHKVVIYDRVGVKQLPEGKRKVYDFVQEHYKIPRDFEADHKFGPLSGVSYEERVISAYMGGLLQLKKRRSDTSDENELRACYTCGGMGHWPDSCPEGF